MSKLRDFDVITQLKSWLSINPVIGCPTDCAYCIRHEDDIEITEPKQIETSSNAIEKLQQNRFFVPHKTHLAVHNMATDPFLPNSESKKVTFEILGGLDSLGYENNVGLITKHLVKEEDIDFLESLSNLNLTMMLSYSEMPERIEPQGNKVRIKTLENLSGSELNTILYWRPIVDGWNTDRERIDTVLENGEKYADAFVMSGLTFTEKIKENLKGRGIEPPYEKTDPLSKQFPKQVVNKILETYREIGITKPLFRKTSCGVSYLEEESDYNTHWENREKYCLETCPKKQKERCYNIKPPKESQVKSLMEKARIESGFKICDEFLELDTKIEREELNYLRQNLRFPVV